MKIETISLPICVIDKARLEAWRFQRHDIDIFIMALEASQAFASSNVCDINVASFYRRHRRASLINSSRPVIYRRLSTLTFPYVAYVMRL